MQVDIRKYRVYKGNKLTGLMYASIGTALDDIMRQVMEMHNGNCIMQIGINPKHISEYALVRIYNTESVLIANFKIEVHKEHMRLIDDSNATPNVYIQE